MLVLNLPFKALMFLTLMRLFVVSSRRLHTRWTGDWSSDVCSSDLDLARPAARHVPGGQAWWRGADLDGDRRLQRGAGPGRGWVAPDLELALDLHRQCADRAGRPGDRLATAAEDRRPRHTPAGRMGRRVGDGMRRPADVRHGQGERVGLALGYDRREPGRRRALVGDLRRA